MSEELRDSHISDTILYGYLEIAKKMTCFLSEINRFFGELSFYWLELVVAPAIKNVKTFLENTHNDLSQVRLQMSKFSAELSKGMFLNPEQSKLLVGVYKLFKVVENFSIHCFDLEKLAFFEGNADDDLKTFECGLLDMRVDFRAFRNEFIFAFKKEETHYYFSEEGAF